MRRGTKYANDWTDERVALLRKLWGDGLSASQIGKQIDASREAVCGKARRLNLASRTKQEAANTSRLTNRSRLFVVGATVMEKADAPPPKVAIKASAFDPLPGTSPRPFTTREFGECAWPVGGEGADTLSCCAPIHRRTWCAAHLKLGTQPMRPKQSAKEYIRRYAA